MFKIRYCHKIFDDVIYREAMHTLLTEAAYEAEIELGEIGFDDNHVHFLADIGLYDRAEIAKLLKGPTGKHFFEFFPELKLPKWFGGKFWASGLWNPAYYIGVPKNLANTVRYIRGQKYGRSGKSQAMLTSFA
jgi:REP element-mobilizing transposase RayT